MFTLIKYILLCGYFVTLDEMFKVSCVSF